MPTPCAQRSHLSWCKHVRSWWSLTVFHTTTVRQSSQRFANLASKSIHPMDIRTISMVAWLHTRMICQSRMDPCSEHSKTTFRSEMRDLAPVDTHTRVAQLYDEIPKLWCSDSYKRMPVKGINSIGGVCHDIQKSGGT